MSFNNSTSIFSDYVTEALKDVEIRQAATKLNLNDELLRNEVLNVEKGAWEMVAGEIADFDKEEGVLKSARSSIEKELPADHSLRNSSLTLASIVLFVYLVAAIIVGSKVAITFSLTHWILAGLSLLLSFFVIFGIWVSRHETREQNFRIAQGNKIGIPTQEEHLQSLRLQIRDIVIKRYILENLRLFINRQMEASYGTSLNVLSHSGLSEISNARFEIDTSAKEKLLRLIESVPGASIGVAGPRGVGKTTLLNALCRTETGAGKKPLAVFTSAPVEYTSRDFLLHLYSSVCRSCLGEKEKSESQNTIKELMRREAKLSDEPSKKYRHMGPILIALGIVLSLSGLLIARIEADASSKKQNVPASDSNLPKANTNPPNVSSTPFLDALEIKPWPMVQSGIMALFLGLCISVFYFKDSFAQLQKRISSFLKALPAKRLRAFEILRQAQPAATPLDPVQEEAQNRIEQIRFQRSFSSGWSGALKLPIGAETGITTGMSWAQNQLSLPELVDEFRTFLIKIRGYFSRILICIDELDKLESTDQAHQFLNQIKAVFGIQGCFYLISVSENAISSFERRGLPFRDVFDSCLDTIIYVDYFNLTASRTLLERRVIGLPIPFVALCYCMSGGLPRDLLRVCRELMEFKKTNANTLELSLVCAELVNQDVQSKLRAVSIAVQQIKRQVDLSIFLTAVANLQGKINSAQSILEQAETLLTKLPKPTTEKDSESVAAQSELLTSLQLELSAYLYYSGTLMEFLGQKSSPTIWQEIEKTGAVDRLARGRQALALDPHLSIAIVSEFRKGQSMTYQLNITPAA